MTDHALDLSHLARVLAEAQARADALPYQVTFHVDEENGVFIMRGLEADGLWVNGSSTGDRLASLLIDPEQSFDRMFGFLEASFNRP